MSYAALMVYVDVDGVPEQRVRIASEIARKFDVAPIGSSAHAVPPLFVAEGGRAGPIEGSLRAVLRKHVRAVVAGRSGRHHRASDGARCGTYETPLA